MSTSRVRLATRDRAAHCFRALDVAPASKSGEVTEQVLLISVEEAKGPVHRVPERLVPFRTRTRASDQDPEPIVEPCDEFLEAHPAQPRCCQLDREWLTVEPRAELDDRVRIHAPRR